MDEFSSQARQDIAPDLAAWVEAYREAYSRDPDELALWKVGQAASRDNRDAKTDADPAQQIRTGLSGRRHKPGWLLSR